ncbi:hypothetical protein [Pseudonocardia broussonetiae]|uniref:Uncharacterized protein n=1 Tax=Pseudonocardia broussonetiae TaxID=2736640 RepID=A0A6M6JPS8_9PSEU|nr:hypothetical protein [Pseudonocardia broussonetiae]QJY49405.1 hypothetical protein HOP40_29635 [Pseudonocardia broussonetiae]
MHSGGGGRRSFDPEYGIPAVICVRDATQLIVTDEVELPGSSTGGAA